MLKGSRTFCTQARDGTSSIQYERLAEAAVESESSDVPTALVTAGMVDLGDSPEPGFMLAIVTAVPPSGDDADTSAEDRETAREDRADAHSTDVEASQCDAPLLCPLS
jgi:hypothetical protein